MKAKELVVADLVGKHEAGAAARGRVVVGTDSALE